MGFLTRALVPRSARRAMHPVRTAKSAATPRVVKQARSALNPIDSTIYSAERALNTKSRKSGRPRTLRALDEPETGNTPFFITQREKRALGIAAIVIAMAIVACVVLFLATGWGAATFLATMLGLPMIIGGAYAIIDEINEF